MTALSPVAGLTQTDIDALWLACRLSVDIGDVPRNLRGRAQLRLQRLVSAGIVSQPFGKPPILKEKP
jgi:hypothetical protein